MLKRIVDENIDPRAGTEFLVNEKLVQQIAAEAKELADVPKIPIAQFIGGSWQRCHICGGMFPKSELVAFDRVRQTYRLACKDCRRNG